jgi:hypothetical protein
MACAPSVSLTAAAARRRRIISWIAFLAVAGGSSYAYYRYNESTTKVEVAVAKVRKAEFIISVDPRRDSQRQ